MAMGRIAGDGEDRDLESTKGYSMQYRQANTVKCLW